MSAPQRSVKRHKIKQELPDVLLPIECSDKAGFKDKWYPKRNLLNFVKPFRLVAMGVVNSGKSNSIKNIIARSDFEHILVVVFNKESTSEWSNLGDNVEVTEKLPDPKSIQLEGVKLLVIDDVDLSNLTKEQKYRISRLWGFCSSHCNMSIALTSQDCFHLPTFARRNSNVIIINKCNDISSLNTIASRFGLKAKQLTQIFQDYFTTPHSSLWIDLTTNSPMMYRLDGFKELVKIDDKFVLKEKKLN